MSMLTVEECELLSDSKYRSYISQVEKALRSFEYTSEWADLISALGKLNKVLLNHLKYPVIPKKVTIGKRLAQCLHPALPSGVHLKALEAYDIIFKCIGPQRLAQDLFVYSAGLFPVIAHAAMSVKPVLLTVYEKHFVPLGRQIKPGLNGLLLGLLPGLEEGAEYFDRTNTLLEEFCQAADPPFFYTGVWECILNCPSVRLPAVTFLVNHFNKRRSMEDQLHMMGLDIDLLVQALCNALQDTSVLVQRVALDFLLLAFPMHNGQLTRKDLAKVVEAAVNVVLRRDMSLNRRLYLWFLGSSAHQAQASAMASNPDSSATRRPRTDSSSTISEFDLTYFHNYSKELLVSALKQKLTTAGQDGRLGEDGHLAVLKPFRILISLLDKAEIGPVIIEDVLLYVFRSLYLEGTKSENVNSGTDDSAGTGRGLVKDSKHVEELVKTANLLFGSFESYFIWDFIGRLFSGACDRTREACHRKMSVSSDSGDVISLKELCHIVEFLLDVVSLDVYPESTTEHLPDLLHQVITAATGCVEAASDLELTAILSMCSKLLSRVQPSMATPTGDDPFDTDSLYRVSDAASTQDSEATCVYAEGAGDAAAGGDAAGGSGEASSSSKKSKKTDQRNGTETSEKVTDSAETKNKSETAGKRFVEGDDSGLRLSEAEKNSEPGKDHSEKDGLDASPRENTAVISSAREKTEPASVKADADKPRITQLEPKTEIPSESRASRGKHMKDLPLRTTSKDKEPVKPASRQKSREDKPREHLGLMQQCLGSFQEFFHCIVTHRFLESETVCEKCMELLSLSPSEGCRTADQDSLFDESSICSADNDAVRARLLELGSHPKIKPRMYTEEGRAAFTRACRLLVDFASFPLYCADYQTVIDQMYNTEDEGALPPWLQDLLTCSCYIQNFQLQASAVATMLDLITLTKSVQSETQNKTRDSGRMSVSEGRVSVVILPALLPRHLQHINDNTIFYQAMAQELWRHLGSESTELHHRTAELFYTLHQVTPRAWICEDAIGADLISDDETTRLNAFKKFSVLWHLTRSMKADSTLGHEVRTFDRSMFVVLDSLKEESSAAKSLAIAWLTQVVQRGDVSRVLRPLLLMMLHPDTARISIQHVNVHNPQRVSLSDAESDSNPEANIYAISSDGGNMIFHVNHNTSFKMSRKSTEDLKSIALTVMSEKGGQLSTAPVRAHSEAELTFERVKPEDLKLRFNPFGSVNSLDKLIFDGFELPGRRKVPPDLSSAKRLDRETCQKEGIFFDGKEEEEPPPELTSEVFVEKELTPEEVVAEIMTDLLNRVVAKVSGSEGQGAGESDDHRKDSVTSSQMCDHDLLNAIETASLEVDSTSSSETDLPRASQDRGPVKGILNRKGGKANGADEAEGIPEGIHPLHMHLLLYTQPYDYRRMLYALSTIRAMLVQCPRLVVTAMATTSISAIRAPHLARIQTLLARHRKSVFGKNFFGELPAEVMSSYRSNMFLEVAISLCLYCMRGYYPNLMMSRLTEDELLGNNYVHSQAAEVLTLLLSELLSIMRDSGRSFVSYISDLLGRCKLQKALLHTLLASVYDARLKSHSAKKSPSLTEAIIEFNGTGLDSSIKEAFQMSLLRLVLVTIMLEDQITLSMGGMPSELPVGANTEWDRVRTSVQYSLTKVRFRAMEPITQQTMFLSGVLSALKQRHLCHLHRNWVGLVTSALPFIGRALTQVVLCVVSQLCRNLEELAGECVAEKFRLSRVPPDHMVTLLEGLTTLCHYCLLDSNTNMSIGQPTPAPTSSITTETASAGHILTNLIHVFNPVGSSRETSPQRDASPVSPVLEARSNLLSILPRIMACMSTLWKAVHLHDNSQSSVPRTSRQQQDGVYRLIMGDPKVVRQHILELLSPLSLLHGNHLLAAFAVAWNDRRQKPSAPIKKTGMLPKPCEDQMLLVELIGAIKVLPMDTLIQIIKSVLKQPPQTELSKNKKSVPLEVNLLQLFFAYVQEHSGAQLLDSWPALLSLIKEVMAMGLQPPATFLLLHILNDFVQKAPTMEEKKSQKELQDITQKLLESVTMIAGTSLEQTTWLRRNYAVKPGRQSELADGDEAEPEEAEAASQVKVKAVPVSGAADSKYSVQALLLLAELTAPMLDVVYSSEEKEKVVPFLTTLLQNVFPYLRHHSADNLPSFRACSQLLASVSGYMYTRKAWRKEGLELLLDLNFFQMDARSLASWKLVVDNLLTHDRTTYKDLMSRVSMTQSGSLNLFSSKEQEFDLRAQMLKRLSFTIFCSPLDQYQRNMPEIQERLAESLRLPQIPNVMTQVFLCFRVLILRMSPQHLTSLWPTMITEMVQVFLQIEQELSTETDEFNQYIRTRSRTQLQRIAALDASWAHLGNGLNAHNNPSWLNLYLSVCRLLDLCLVMPADSVPQFQLYRWAFIGTAGEENKGCGDDNAPKQKDQPRFTPHIIRLARLLNTRLNREAPILRVIPGRPLLTIGQLRSIAELQPFFNTLCLQQHEKATSDQPKALTSGQSKAQSSGGLQVPPSGMTKSHSAPEKLESRQSPEMQLKTCQQYMEELLERDFLELVS